MNRIALLLALLISTWSSHTLAYMDAPKIRDLGQYHYQADTSSETAQSFFSQGQLFFWGSQFGEAIRAFKSAINHDDNCGFCYYMLALSYGSLSNAPLTGHERQYAIDAVAQGLHKMVISPKARALLQALTHRYYKGPEQTVKQYTLQPFNLNSLNERESYMEAMKDIAQKYDHDPEIQALYAFSLYDIHQNVFWQGHTPAKYTNQLLTQLEDILERYPNHPGAQHLYLNVIQHAQSSYEAQHVSKTLQTQFPGLAFPQMAAAHIALKNGQIHQATDNSMQAIASYQRYQRQCHVQHQGNPYNYFEQTLFFNLWQSALLEGRQGLVDYAAHSLNQVTTQKQLDRTPELQFYLASQYVGKILFQDWQAILTLPEPSKRLPFVRSTWYLASGLSFAHLNKLQEAKIVLKNIEGLLNDEEQSQLFHGDLKRQISISQAILKATIAEKEHNPNLATEEWRKAEKLYTSSAPYLQPIWTLLIKTGLAQSYTHLDQYQRAKDILEDYLNIQPNNPWALRSLYVNYKKLGQTARAEQTYRDSLALWKYADRPFGAS